MKTRATAIAALTILFLSAPLLAARPARATTVDGVLDAGYGSALVTQTTQTGLSNGQITGDNTDNDLNFASGSELDAAYGFISNQVLYLFLAGNVALELTPSGASSVGHILDVFVDSVPGGQNSLNGLGTGNLLNGLTFDGPFTADYLFELEGSAGSHIPATWTASYAAFGTPFGATFSTLGSGTAGGPGAPAPGLALVGVGPNPSRGERLPVSFTLADAGPARLQVVDCAGHIVRAQAARASAGLAGVIDLAGGRPLAPGMYWVRLWQGAGRVTRSVCVVH
jgi:hypothetical protein